MSVRYDEKGKFFTPVISKDPISVIIQTLLHRIEGNIYARQGERIRDALNRDDQFVAVTDTAVFNSQGKEIYKSEFLLVNRDHIVWMIPTEESDSE